MILPTVIMGDHEESLPRPLFISSVTRRKERTDDFSTSWCFAGTYVLKSVQLLQEDVWDEKDLVEVSHFAVVVVVFF